MKEEKKRINKKHILQLLDKLIFNIKNSDQDCIENDIRCDKNKIIKYINDNYIKISNIYKTINSNSTKINNKYYIDIQYIIDSIKKSNN